jgi:hypothetical protein
VFPELLKADLVGGEITRLLWAMLSPRRENARGRAMP